MLSLNRKRATGNFFDVTGERIFVMGHEKTGIGEIWVPPFRVLSSLQWGVRVNGNLRWFQEYPASFSSLPEGVVREIVTPHWTLTEEVTCSRQEPSALSRLRFTRLNGPSRSPRELPTHVVVRAVVEFRLMWPYPSSVVTATSARWREELKAFELRDERNLFTAVLGSSQPSDRQELDRPESKTRWVASLIFDLKDHRELDLPFVVAASDGNPSEALDAYERIVGDREGTHLDQATYHNDHINRCVVVESPDVQFNRGYQWALVGMDRHFLHTPGLGKGYAAGFAETTPGWGESRPGYAWYFGRDSVWTSLAALVCGDFEKVRQNLKLLGDFQDLSGKIFHELTLSGVVHYDSADSTPLYVALMGEFLRWSGDREFVHSQWGRIEKAMTFLKSTIHNDFHFIENRNVGHGWVEFGPLAGSDVEIYLAGCWAEALRQMAYMARVMDRGEVARVYECEYKTVTANMNDLFWNEAARTYDVGLRLRQPADNKTETTVLPAVPILFDHLPFDRSRSMASLFSREEFSTKWGVRIQSAASPSYRGSGYHTGSVWPLFTGWCSLAEYRTHLHREGLAHVVSTLRTFKSGALGWVGEVFNGETGRPAGVCRHQAWSEAMVCLPVIRGMLGLEADAQNSWIRIRPHIPPAWKHLNVKGIRLGNNRLSFSFRRKNEKHEFRFDVTGQEPVNLEFEPWIDSDLDAITTTINGESKKVAVHRFGDCPHPKLPVRLEGIVTITFT